MANPEHVKLLKQNIEDWNQWRKDNPEIRPDLQEAHLAEANLVEANLFEANLVEANLYRTHLRKANLQRALLSRADLSKADCSNANLKEAVLSEATLLRANFSGADLSLADLTAAILFQANFIRAKLDTTDLSNADLSAADFSRANLTNANLTGANLHGVNFTRAVMSNANLEFSTLVETNFEKANISGCRVYGISAWNVLIDSAVQSDLIITRREDPTIKVDNLEVAQFIYLLLNNSKLREVISTIGNKAVLILGRFSDDRIEILYSIANKLRKEGFLPIIFDFERSQERDLTETIKLLCGLSLFVVVDITNPKSSPLELQATVPDYSIPFVVIIQEGETPFPMFVDLQKFSWVVKPIVEYDTKENLIKALDVAVIKPALLMHDRLVRKKGKKIKKETIKDILKRNTKDAT